MHLYVYNGNMHPVYVQPAPRGLGEGPDPIDIHVGQRLKARRVMLGLSQEKLAESLGLTFQQIQKYERGANRISASRLYHLSRVLDAPVSFFFDDLAGHGDYAVPDTAGTTLHESGSDASYEADPLKRDETLRLVCAYYRHHDPETRRRFIELMEMTSRFPATRKPATDS
jgi:transcriptional regulator with XRE-family HTH domain